MRSVTKILIACGISLTAAAVSLAWLGFPAMTGPAQSTALDRTPEQGSSAPRASVGTYTLECATVSFGGDIFPDGQMGIIGQPVVGVVSNASYTLEAGAVHCLTHGTGVPAATVTSAVSRRSNPSGPGGFCDLTLLPPRRSEPRSARIGEVRVGFNVPPGTPSGSGITLEQATCAAPAFAPYSGASAGSGAVTGNELVLTFTPALENARTYRITLGPEVTSLAGQFVEVRGLVGDVNGDGQVNATDRSVVVGAWTGPGFSCPTDLNGDGASNATDRSVAVGAWTGSQNCAP